MLLIHRSKGEEIVIDGGITVCVVSIKRGSTPDKDKVTLGFNAPKDIVIHRKEVDDAIRSGRELLEGKRSCN